jgi:predicted NUDIX family phosphoesterase
MTDKCQDELAQFDRHISEVKQSIEKKLDLIEKLKREGRDTAEAEELLDTLIQMLRAMLDHRLAILKRLAPLSTARLK